LRHTVDFVDFFLQKKHITAIIWFGLAVLTQISLRETSDNSDVMRNFLFALHNLWLHNFSDENPCSHAKLTIANQLIRLIGIKLLSEIFCMEVHSTSHAGENRHPDDGAKTFVEVPDKDPTAEPHKVEIETGLSDGLQIEIVSGLEEGDKVVERPPRDILG